MKRLVLTTAAFGMLAFPALSADMAPAPVYKAPMPVPVVYGWTGCYAGVNAGGVWGSSQNTWSGITESGGAFAAGAATVLPAAANATINSSGFTGGGQIGCNYQTGAWVFGGEADIEYNGLSGNRSAISQALPTIVPGNITETFSSHWLSTVRGRLGYAAGSLLFYGTGGLAIANVNSFDQVCFPTAAFPACSTGTGSETRTGWAAGGGVEWAFAPRWTVKAEYLHVDLGTNTYTAVSSAAAFPNATIQQAHQIREDIARIGVNYRFW